MSSVRSPVAKRVRVEDDMDVDQPVCLGPSDSASTITQRKQNYQKVDLYCPHPLLLALTQQAKLKPAPKPLVAHRRHNAVSTTAGFQPPRTTAPSGDSTWFVGQPNPVTPPRHLPPRVPPPRPARPVQINSNAVPRHVPHSNMTMRQLVHPMVPAAPPNAAPLHHPPPDQAPPDELVANIHRVLSLVEDVRPSDISALAPLFASMFWQIRRYYRYLRLNARQMTVMSMIARITANCIPPGTRTILILEHQLTLRELIMQLEHRHRSRVAVRPITIPPDMVQSDGSASTQTSSSVFTPADSPAFVPHTESSHTNVPRLPASETFTAVRRELVGRPEIAES